MSRTLSPSSNKPYGVARVTAVWEMARSSYYAGRKRQQEPPVPLKRGPKRLSDEELVSEIRQVLERCVFHGEGYRKVWARLRHKKVRAWKDRVLRVMREHSLLSPSRAAVVTLKTHTRAPSSSIGLTNCGEPTGPRRSPNRTDRSPYLPPSTTARPNASVSML
jgi:hypothetical protein